MTASDMAGKKGMKGGGRPKTEDPRVLLTVRVSGESARLIKALRKYGFNIGRWIDRELEMYSSLVGSK